MAHALILSKFTSPLALIHTIIHGLNTPLPSLTYYEQGTGIRLFGTEEVIDANTVRITFAVQRAINGTVQ